MNKEDLRFYTNDMKFKLSKDEEEKFLEDFKKFENRISNIKEINTEDVEMLVSPTYDMITTYLREDEITDEVEDSKEAVSLSKDYKDGFFTIPKVVN